MTAGDAARPVGGGGGAPPVAVRRVTSRDVARVAGVSQNTVSLVSRDSPRVRPETKAAVRAVMADLGYHPNAVAAALRSRNSPALQFVVSAELVGNHLTADLVAGAIDGARAAGYSLAICALDPRHPELALAAFQTRWVSGALVQARHIDDPLVATLASGGCPTISLLQPSSACPPEWVVRADDGGGARAAVLHLLERGHRHLGLIAPEPGINAVAIDRVAAARAVAAEAGSTLVTEQAADWTVAAGTAAALRLLARPRRPEAIFAISDRLAFGVLAAAATCGLAVPADLAVVGFDNTEWSQHCSPPLTTVEFPMQAIGRLGAQRLVAPERAAGPAPPLPARLIVRASS